MLKKILSLLFAVLLCASVYHYATADGLFSESCFALVKARQLLKDTYGLDQNLAAYFTEAVIPEDGGYRVVFYSNFDDLDYVLGRYTATIKGDDASITWSWDGQQVPYSGNGLASQAWDKDQLREIWLINKQTYRMSDYGQIAIALAKSAGYTRGGYIAPLPEPARNLEDNYGEYDPSKAVLTEEESWKIALNAIKEAYGLSDERLKSIRMEDETTWYEGNAAGEPMRTFVFILWNENEWTEGNGNYYVTVNQTTGLVENLYYLDGIIGNG